MTQELLLREFFQLVQSPEPLDEERAASLCHRLHLAPSELMDHHQRASRLRQLESQQHEFQVREELNAKRAEMIAAFNEERSRLIDALSRQISRLTRDHRAEARAIAEFQDTLDQARESVLVHPDAELSSELVDALTNKLLGQPERS